MHLKSASHICSSKEKKSLRKTSSYQNKRSIITTMHYILFYLALIISSSYSFHIPTNSHSVTRRWTRSTTSMNMIDRFFRVVSSNVNSVLKGLEDPEKVLDQAVNDMQSDLVKIRQSYAEISATLKRMQNQKQSAENLANVS